MVTLGIPLEMAIHLHVLLAENGVLPIANMPTEQRSLYHATASRRIGTVDGTIEQAITMFALGSVTTKDKQKHLSIGITGPIQLARGKLRRKANQDMPWTWRDEVTIDLETNTGTCRKCRTHS